jgi:hypothetical protein
MQTSTGVVPLCEALLRNAATLCEKAARLQDDTGAAAAATKKAFTLGVEDAEQHLQWLMRVFGTLVGHKVIGSFPGVAHRPSTLALAALSAGPGSDLQRQLFSLLCTMVKLGSAPAASMVPEGTLTASKSARNFLLVNAAHTAVALLVGAQEGHQPSTDAAFGSHAASAVPKLARVLIFGRCCMWWAHNMQAYGDLEGYAQTLVKQPQAAELLLPPMQQWLQASNTQEQLVAAGYAPQALPQQLQQVKEALQAVRESAISARIDSSFFLDTAQQLHAAGSAMCSFAVSCLCNNPSCANLSGLTELGSLSGRSCVCGGCRVARYCGRACQREVWKQHKPVCAALAAAAAAAATSSVETFVVQ